MITSLIASLFRVTAFWYLVGLLILFIGSPDWAEAAYRRLALYPYAPGLELHGLGTAASVQWTLLSYWTLPILVLWLVALAIGVIAAEVKCRIALTRQTDVLIPRGEFWGVVVPNFSMGHLPKATTPEPTGARVSLDPSATPSADIVSVEVTGALKEAVRLLTTPERQLAEELLQLLLADPDHYAGAGHGVGLLEHTLNVVSEAAQKVTSEFRLPLLAALAHDVGKLLTFQPDGKGGWIRKGLHSRESARILATLKPFQDLPEVHQRALLLAVKYDHTPNKMPELRGEREACNLALRTINALAQADRKATADEKERHLERLQPEDLLWKDFVDYLRDAPVVQRGKKGAANQVNNPADSNFIFLYEAPWRDAAVKRLPPEVAAVLDLTRRDAGKLAKYTRILAERLRKEGVLVESYVVEKDGAPVELTVSETNPLWDIQSGTGEKAVVLRGIIVLKADDLWKKLNYRISIKSPFPVSILAPTADPEGKVQNAPKANRAATEGPDVSDGLKLADISSSDALRAIGLSEESAAVKPKARARDQFKAQIEAAPADESTFGFKDSAPKSGVKRARVTDSAPAVEPHSGDEPKPTEPQAVTPELADQDLIAERQAQELDALSQAEELMDVDDQDLPSISEASDNTSSSAMATALTYLSSAAGHQASEALPDEPQFPAVAPEREPAAETLSEPPKAAVRNKETKSVNPQGAKAESAKPADVGADLSRAEKREGLAIADAAAVEKYPNLKVGDKYYTEASRAVQAGLKKPGGKYNGDTKARVLDLTDEGPRRGRRRVS